MSNASPRLRSSSWSSSTAGLLTRDHHLSVPLDRSGQADPAPDGTSSITVYAREISAAGIDPLSRPPLVFLQGGPGCEAPRPSADAGLGWIGAVLEHHRLILIDQRGTGASSPVLGSSGTIKTVHQVICENIDPNGTITAERLNQLIQQTLQFSHFDQIQFNGLNHDRADVFVPGLAILSAVFENFHIEKMRYSDGALREGVMYSLEQNFQVNNIRERTALGLMEQFNIDQAQGERVYQSASLLFEQYQHWQNQEIVAEMKDVLLWAARLHEVGIVINHKNLQKHSAYILYNTELPGYDNEQHRLLSTLARYHLGNFKLPEMFKFSRYHEQDVLALIRILRLAIILNRARQATEKPQKITLKTDRTLVDWHLTFETDYLQHNPLVKNDLALEHRFLQTLGLSLSTR